MPEAIEKRALLAIEKKVFPGGVIGILHNGERMILPFGTLDGTEPVTENSVYDVASVTKSIPTASLIALLMQEGKLAHTDAAKRYIPELQNDHGATIDDLLRYRVTGMRMSSLADQSADELTARLLSQGFEGPAGESRYTNMPAFLLGLIIERIENRSLDRIAKQKLFEPLQMSSTTFFPSAGDHNRNIAPSEIDSRGEVRGLPHDESAYVCAKAGRSAGHAGLFSTASDLMNFLEQLVQYKGPTFITVADDAEKGLGWQLHEPFFMGSACGQRTIGKTGFTGCSVVSDREKHTALVILSNRTYPKRPSDATSPQSAINTFRRDIADIVFAR